MSGRVFPFNVVRWAQLKLGIDPDHHGSENWADYFGLAGYHDNSYKKKRRIAYSMLTLGGLQIWFRRRGLGSPPD